MKNICHTCGESTHALNGVQGNESYLGKLFHGNEEVTWSDMLKTLIVSSILFNVEYFPFKLIHPVSYRHIDSVREFLPIYLFIWGMLIFLILLSSKQILLLLI